MSKKADQTTTVLVTGLNGLIGWGVYEACARSFRTFGTYRKRHLKLKGENLFRIDLLNAAELKALFNETKPDYVIHSWAMCDLDICETFPEMAEKINVRGTKLLLNAAAESGGVKKFVYVSTDHVFGGETGGYLEEDEPSPKHVYGRTKLRAEKIVREGPLPFLIVRPGLVIGKSLQGNKGPRDFLFTRIRAEKPTHYFTDEWRSPLSVKVLAERLLKWMVTDETGIVHIAGKKSYSRYELALAMAEKEKLPTKKIFPRLRREDTWAHIRPRDITLKSSRTEDNHDW